MNIEYGVIEWSKTDQEIDKSVDQPIEPNNGVKSAYEGIWKLVSLHPIWS